MESVCWGNSTVGSNPTLSAIILNVRPGHIGNRSYRRHGLHQFWAKRVVQRLQRFFLQIDVAQIIVHKTDQPNSFFDFLQTDRLTGEDRAEINFLAMQADSSTAGNLDGFVVERISQLRQTAIGPRGGSVDFRGTFHVQRLMRPFVVELFAKRLEPALLLQTVGACGTRGFVFEREMHAFMAAILLRMAGLDAFDGDAQA